MCGRAFLERGMFAKSKNNFLTTNRKSHFGFSINFIGEFDPGSGRTLAACLTHASRTEKCSTLSF